jgi:hypothetical protein
VFVFASSLFFVFCSGLWLLLAHYAFPSGPKTSKKNYSIANKLLEGGGGGEAIILLLLRLKGLTPPFPFFVGVFVLVCLN